MSHPGILFFFIFFLFFSIFFFYKTFDKTQTAIHRALAHGHLAVIQVLLDNGARSIGFASDNTVKKCFASFIQYYYFLYNVERF